MHALSLAVENTKRVKWTTDGLSNELFTKVKAELVSQLIKPTRGAPAGMSESDTLKHFKMI